MTNLSREILTLICTHNNPETLLEELSKKIGTGFNGDFCLVLADKKSLDSLASGFWHASGSSFHLNVQFLSDPIIQDLWMVDRVVAIAELADSSNWSIPVKAILGVRTEFQSQANGLILLGLSQSHKWTEQEADLLREIRDQLAIACALVTKKVIEPISNPTALPQGNINSVIPLVKRLCDLTRRQLEEERKLNEMKDEIIATISDKARNPLASMKMAMDGLFQKERDLSPAVVEQFQRILREEWGNLNELINHIVTLQQLRSQELTVYPQTLYLESLIQELTTSFREQWTEDPRKNLRIEGEIGNPLPTIRTDCQHLRAILQELLTNAGNFSHSRTTVYLKVFSQNQQEAKEPTLSIGVINTGKGISEAEIPLIFQAFKRGEGVTGSIPGTGIGLALVDGLVKLLGGTIEVISTPDPTSSSHITQFTLTLPQNPPPPKENL